MSASPSDLAAILERLERLERQNRMLKRLGLALVCLVGLGALAAAQKPAAGNVVTGDKFVLQDAKGKPRIMLASFKDQSGIVFYGPDGRQQRAVLVSEPRGVALRYIRPDGTYSSGICCERGGIGLLGINDAGRNQTEVNAIIVPGRMLLSDYTFPVKPEEKK